MPSDAADLEPGPRAQRVAADRRRRRVRLAVGGALVAVAAVAGAVVLLGDDGGDERPVGQLIASDLPDAAAPTDAPTTTAGGTPTTVPPTGGPTTPGGAAPTEPTAGEGLQPKAQWPGPVRGRPEAFGGDGDAPPADAGELADGFYLFFDQAGWHLWMVGGDGTDASVEVAVDEELPRADPVGGAPDLQVDGNRFRLARGGEAAAVTGVDFSTGFYGKTMVVTVDGDLPLFIGSTTKPAEPVLGLQLNRENR